MAYCTAADVRRIINTSLGNTDIESEITLADAEIDARELGSRGANLLKNISRFIVASYIANRDPQSGPVGEGSQTYRSPREWREMAERFIQRTGGPPIYISNDPLPTE